MELDINDTNLVAHIEQLSTEALDVLPFGVIRLDRKLEVTYFSRAEAEQSGYGNRPAIGLRFFTEIAPCMSNPEFMQRIDRALAERRLDISFEQVGDFDDAQRVLRVRAASTSDGGLWLFLDRRS